MQIAEDLNIKYSEVDITKEELFKADELFFTGTATEVIGIVSIDDLAISNEKPGEITNKIRTEYMDRVLGKNDKYLHWLTKVD